MTSVYLSFNKLQNQTQTFPIPRCCGTHKYHPHSKSHFQIDQCIRSPRRICPAQSRPDPDRTSQVCFCPHHLLAYSHLSSTERRPAALGKLPTFLATLAILLQDGSPANRDVAVQCLEALLARPECRKMVWEIPGIIKGYVSVTIYALKIW